MPICEHCGKEFYAGEGLWDDGDYMCGECVAKHIEKSEKLENGTRSSKPERTITVQVKRKK